MINNFRDSYFYKVYRYLYSFHFECYLEQLIIYYKKQSNTYSKEIRLLHNKFEGERCFIVANGPSLTFEDLDKIKGEHCFSMNSVIKVLDKTEWRPEFYGIQDQNVYDKIPDIVEKCPSRFIFVGNNIIINPNQPLQQKPYVFDLRMAGHYADNPHPKFRFSNDASICVYDGFSITYSLLQIACYLGFKDIYLIGCDCSYSKDPEKQHFANSGHVDMSAYKIGGLQIEAFKCANKACKDRGIHIYNATRGGALEVFPRVKLEEIL